MVWDCAPVCQKMREEESSLQNIITKKTNMGKSLGSPKPHFALVKLNYFNKTNVKT